MAIVCVFFIIYPVRIRFQPHGAVLAQLAEVPSSDIELDALPMPIKKDRIEMLFSFILEQRAEQHRT